MKPLKLFLPTLLVSLTFGLLAGPLMALRPLPLNGPTMELGGEDVVLLTGWLHVDDGRVDDVELVVEVEGDRCLYSEVFTVGRFICVVPVNSKATLTFIKPGHLTKVVVVDTRNAMNTKRARRMNDKVKFDVVLEPELMRCGKAYDGPVGSIGFVNGSGLMTVHYDLKLVSAELSEACKGD